MRIFLAGASGVIGIRLVPLLTADGHQVGAMTRSVGKADRLRSLGAEPIVCDVFEPDRLIAVVTTFAPTAVMQQLADLPDRVEQLNEYGARNDRMRTEGTRNLLAAAKAAGAARFLAQSIAWRPAGRGAAVVELERQVLERKGVVIRYGQLYGPGTFYEHEPPGQPRLHVDAAADATAQLLEAPPGVILIAEDERGRVSPQRQEPHPLQDPQS
jgi:hypothetical protein